MVKVISSEAREELVEVYIKSRLGRFDLPATVLLSELRSNCGPRAMMAASHHSDGLRGQD
jgi:hypothetical protein